MPYKIPHVGKASYCQVTAKHMSQQEATVASEDMPFMQRSKLATF